MFDKNLIDLHLSRLILKVGLKKSFSALEGFISSNLCASICENNS